MNKIFDNTQVAFSLKSDTELERAYFLFKLIASQPLVKIGTAVTNFALKAHLPVEGLIRSTVFDHFCGGVNEVDCLKVVDNMFTKGVSSVLDYSVEGKEEEAQFDTALEMTLKTIEFAKEREAIPFAVFKPTGFGRIDLYEKVGAKAVLSDSEQKEYNRIIERFDLACKTAYEKDVLLLIDAEESWMQDAADAIVTDNMNRLYPSGSAKQYRYQTMTQDVRTGNVTFQILKKGKNDVEEALSMDELKDLQKELGVMCYEQKRVGSSKYKNVFLGFKIVREVDLLDT